MARSARLASSRAVAAVSGVGVRQPADELARRVVREAGGVLAVTSANWTGEPPATTAEEVAAAFGESLLVLDGGPRRDQPASTVVDATDDPAVILREGPLTAAQLGLEPAARPQ